MNISGRISGRQAQTCLNRIESRWGYQQNPAK